MSDLSKIKIPEQPQTTPLAPMPTAPPEIATAWMRRLTTGALLGLVVLVFGFCTSLLTASVPSLYETITVFVHPMSSVAGLIMLWLITSPEPGNPYWLVYLRWSARIGCVAGIIQLVSSLAIREYVNLPMVNRNELAVAYSALMLISLAGAVAMVWYYARLSGRIGDRVLRRNFGAWKWISGVVVTGMVIYALADWQGFCESNFKKLASYRAKPWLLGWACFAFPLSIYFGWLQWRLWRRLRAAANKLREMGESPSAELL